MDESQIWMPLTLDTTVPYQGAKTLRYVCLPDCFFRVLSSFWQFYGTVLYSISPAHSTVRYGSATRIKGSGNLIFRLFSATFKFTDCVALLQYGS